MRAPGQIARETILQGKAGSQNGTRDLKQRPVHQALAVWKPDPSDIRHTEEKSYIRMQGRQFTDTWEGERWDGMGWEGYSTIP